RSVARGNRARRCDHQQRAEWGNCADYEGARQVMTVRKSKALTSALRFSPVKKVSKVAVRDRLEVLIDVAFYRHRGAAVPSDIPAGPGNPGPAAEPYLRQMMEMSKELPSWPKPAGDDKLIAEARRGNTERLARRIEHSMWNGHEFTDELKTFFVELAREMPS